MTEIEPSALYQALRSVDVDDELARKSAEAVRDLPSWWNGRPHESQRPKDSFVSIAEAFSGLDGPVKVIRDTSPQARHHFTQADQVNQFVGASEADADLGFMARLLALCSLPRRKEYIRRNGPYTLGMSARTTAGSRGRGTRVRLRQVARPVVGIRRASQSPVLRAL